MKMNFLGYQWASQAIMNSDPLARDPS